MVITKAESFSEWYFTHPRCKNLPESALCRDCSLRGTLHISYQDLIEIFGEPTQKDHDPGKVRIEWDVYVDGIPVSIYDWKTSTPIEILTQWNVGGHPDAYKAVFEVVKHKLQ